VIIATGCAESEPPLQHARDRPTVAGTLLSGPISGLSNPWPGCLAPCPGYLAPCPVQSRAEPW